VKVVALMYHDVVPAGHEESSGFAGADAARYKLTPEQFDAHLHAIRARAAHAPGTSVVLATSSFQLAGGFGRAGSGADVRTAPVNTPLMLTFDDGGRSASRIADALERRGWRGHFFVTSSRIDGPGFLQRGTIRDLRRRGHVIGSHSHTHPLRISYCTEARLRDEWHRSIATLSDLLGEGVTCASVPGGYHSDLVARTASAAGTRILFTSQPTSRAHRVGDMWVIGRYVLSRSTSAAAAAAIAAGDLTPRLWQAVVWNVKGACKRLGGARYLWIRERILGRSSHPQWGDDSRAHDSGGPATDRAGVWGGAPR
jgi:peptidoglycan/xylan/chitin deacetylase (PgdA/CDA1 family)